jgi:hypothetical protein
MDLKALIGFLAYWFILFSVYTWVLPTNTALTQTNVDNITTLPNVTGNQSYIIGDSDIQSSGFSGLNKFIKTLGFLLLGIGLPSDTPVWFAWVFAAIIIIINTIFIAVIVNSFWSGG